MLQKIFYGAPGTGKSYYVSHLPEIEKASESQIFRTTFHPEYTYSDFTGQLLPVVKNDVITYEYKRGIFTDSLRKAYMDNSVPVYLIIEEMTRGNVAAIFGDIFQLLDRNDKNVSRYPVRNSIIASEIPQLDDSLISLPANFNIIGTVNTNDQNVFAMDTAFKRRFDWCYISTDPVKYGDGNEFNEDNVVIPVQYGDDTLQIRWHKFYMQLNEFITDRNHGLGLSEDKQIGQFFIQFNKKMSSSDIEEKIQNKLMQYLWEDVELASFGNNVRLFRSSINSYADLYRLYTSGKQVFSNAFLVIFDND